jgi:hypothetical protein
MTGGLNIYGLCSAYLHCAKSTLEKMEKCLAIVGSIKKFWGLAAIPSEHIATSLVQ